MRVRVRIRIRVRVRVREAAATVAGGERCDGSGRSS
jgi:hypothetical protein